MLQQDLGKREWIPQLPEGTCCFLKRRSASIRSPWRPAIVPAKRVRCARNSVLCKTLGGCGTEGAP